MLAEFYCELPDDEDDDLIIIDSIEKEDMLVRFIISCSSKFLTSTFPQYETAGWDDIVLKIITENQLDDLMDVQDISFYSLNLFSIQSLHLSDQLAIKKEEEAYKRLKSQHSMIWLCQPPPV